MVRKGLILNFAKVASFSRLLNSSAVADMRLPAGVHMAIPTIRHSAAHTYANGIMILSSVVSISITRAAQNRTTAETIIAKILKTFLYFFIILHQLRVGRTTAGRSAVATLPPDSAKII
jgi:hypothetical protein